jgi:hypothetical protein
MAQAIPPVLSPDRVVERKRSVAIRRFFRINTERRALVPSG